jgi:hypothetical protein
MVDNAMSLQILALAAVANVDRTRIIILCLSMNADGGERYDVYPSTANDSATNGGSSVSVSTLFDRSRFTRASSLALPSRFEQFHVITRREVANFSCGGPEPYLTGTEFGVL